MTRRADIEIHLHPRDPRGRIRSLRLSPGRARLLALAAALVLMVLLFGVVVAPKAVAIRGSHRDYRTSIALRQQLGERMKALVESLNGLDEQGRRLENRILRIERIYGLPIPDASADQTAFGGAREPPATAFSRLIDQGNAVEASLRRRLDEVDRAVIRIAAEEAREPRLARTMPARSPVTGEFAVLSSGFGPQRSPYTQELEFHAGLDFAAPRGTLVVAPADGVVVWAGTVAASRRNDWWRLGRAVVLRHGEEYRTIFGHLDEIRVRTGASIPAGAVLGTVGESGWATAPHLHYEVRRRDGKEWIAVNPQDYLLDVASAGNEGPPGRESGELAPVPLPPEFRR